ncbi:YlaI family protein [Bacillus sp. FSL K6-3431]|uniref:YlaI family protein n=1 Tax=Bacillus sp. FSL K6-3431 TaxID=2921500 RepID=UPI0030F9FA6A
MKVQCVICDQQSTIDTDSPLAKKLRNHPIHTFMCVTCHKRIKENTEVRLAKSSFQLYTYKTEMNEF